MSPPIPGFLQEDVLESPLLGGVIEAGLGYDPAKVAASRRALQPRTRGQGRSTGKGEAMAPEKGAARASYYCNHRAPVSLHVTNQLRSRTTVSQPHLHRRHMD